MASGCVPAHASYFLAYEHLKIWLNLDNEEFNLTKNLLIGCTTTFAHDFFITPADGKLSLYQFYCLKKMLNINFPSLASFVSSNKVALIAER